VGMARDGTPGSAGLHLAAGAGMPGTAARMANPATRADGPGNGGSGPARCPRSGAEADDGDPVTPGQGP
jgi:hypothetical protein